jgi:hypothetical protein
MVQTLTQYRSTASFAHHKSTTTSTVCPLLPPPHAQCVLGSARHIPACSILCSILYVAHSLTPYPAHKPSIKKPAAIPSLPLQQMPDRAKVSTVRHGMCSTAQCLTQDSKGPVTEDQLLRLVVSVRMHTNPRPSPFHWLVVVAHGWMHSPCRHSGTNPCADARTRPHQHSTHITCFITPTNTIHSSCEARLVPMRPNPNPNVCCANSNLET